MKFYCLSFCVISLQVCLHGCWLAWHCVGSALQMWWTMVSGFGAVLLRNKSSASYLPSHIRLLASTFKPQSSHYLEKWLCSYTPHSSQLHNVQNGMGPMLETRNKHAGLFWESILCYCLTQSSFHHMNSAVLKDYFIMGARTYSCIHLSELGMGLNQKKIGTWYLWAVYQGRTVSQLTNERWLEEGFGAAESFISNGDHLAIRKLIAFFQGGGRGSSGHLIFKVQGHVTQLLLDVTDNFTLRCQEDSVFRMVFRKDPSFNTLPIFKINPLLVFQGNFLLDSFLYLFNYTEPLSVLLRLLETLHIKQLSSVMSMSLPVVTKE